MARIVEMLLKKPSLAWNQGRGSRPCFRFRIRDGTVSADCRQFSDRGTFKNPPRRQSEAFLPRAGNNLKTDNGVSAQFEKVVINAYWFNREQAFPDGNQRLLNLISAWNIGHLELRSAITLLGG